VGISFGRRSASDGEFRCAVKRPIESTVLSDWPFCVVGRNYPICMCLKRQPFEGVGDVSLKWTIFDIYLHRSKKKPREPKRNTNKVGVYINTLNSSVEGRPTNNRIRNSNHQTSNVKPHSFDKLSSCNHFGHSSRKSFLESRDGQLKTCPISQEKSSA
jgi:hypothetical protein